MIKFLIKANPTYKKLSVDQVCFLIGKNWTLHRPKIQLIIPTMQRGDSRLKWKAIMRKPQDMGTTTLSKRFSI